MKEMLFLKKSIEPAPFSLKSIFNLWSRCRAKSDWLRNSALYFSGKQGQLKPHTPKVFIYYFYPSNIYVLYLFIIVCICSTKGLHGHIQHNNGKSFQLESCGRCGTVKRGSAKKNMMREYKKFINSIGLLIDFSVFLYGKKLHSCQNSDQDLVQL